MGQIITTSRSCAYWRRTMSSKIRVLFSKLILAYIIVQNICVQRRAPRIKEPRCVEHLRAPQAQRAAAQYQLGWQSHQRALALFMTDRLYIRVGTVPPNACFSLRMRAACVSPGRCAGRCQPAALGCAWGERL